MSSGAGAGAADGQDAVGYGAEDSMGEGMVSAPNYSTQNTEEFAKIEQAIAKKQAAKKAAGPAKKDDVAGVDFKDQPPFEEELPF